MVVRTPNPPPQNARLAKGGAVFFLHTVLVGAKMQPMHDYPGSEEQPTALRPGRWEFTET